MGMLSIARRAMMRVTDAFGGFFNKKLWYPNAGVRMTTAHEAVSEDTALNYSAVWCATRLLCGTGASLPLPVFKGLDGDEREKDREHPVYKLLNRAPNPEMTSYNFRSVMWQWQVNWGNAYAEIVREGNDPEAPVMELWPLHPYRVTPVRDDNGQLKYKVRDEFTREDNFLEPWQVFHVPSIITYDGILGHGVIEHARETVGVGIAAEKRAASDFGNGRLPRVVVESPNVMLPEAREAFRKEWSEIHSGSNGHQVALLVGGATAKPLSFSAADSQFIESRQFTVEEIARWYGVPPHLLQHLLRATFSNVEELGRDFVQYSLNPWLEVWEQSIAHKLLYPDDDQYFAEHNVDALQRGNLQSRSSFYQTMVNAGIMTRAECRKLENLPYMDGSETPLVQGAMVPLDEDGYPVSKFTGTTQEPPAMEADPEDDPEDKKQEPQDDGEDSTEETMKAVATCLHRVILGDLQRFLTKESKAMTGFAKKDGNFLAKVDQFYAEHAVIVRDELAPTFDALSQCGSVPDVGEFVSAWVKEGTRLMLEATETKQNELPASVALRIESKSWSGRPENAVERLKSCNL